MPFPTYSLIPLIVTIGVLPLRSSWAKPRSEELDTQAVLDFKSAIENAERSPGEAAQRAASAAQTWQSLVESTPETSETSQWRQAKIGRTLNAYKLAFSLSHDCTHLYHAEDATTNYLNSIDNSSEPYRMVHAHHASVQAQGAEECPARAPMQEPPTTDTNSTSDSEGRNTSSLLPVEGPPTSTNPRIGSPTSTTAPLVDERPRKFRILAITSGTLAGVSFLISAGTGLSRVREPFNGRAYQAILDAARESTQDENPENNVPHGPNDDMCAIARSNGNNEVVSACNRWDSLGAAATATGILGAIFTVSTVALSVAALRAKRNSRVSMRAGFLGHRGVLIGGTLQF